LAGLARLNFLHAKRKIMRNAMLVALSGAALFSGAALGTPASAMTLGPLPSASGADAALLERVINVCGINGCAPIHVRRIQKPPANFVRRAAPLVFPVANPPPAQPANK
jgi:hypothetical protein